MRPALIILALLCTCYAGAQRQWQLAAPILKTHSNFFQYQAQLNMYFRQPEAVIRYTLNGSEPTEKSKAYKKPVIINKEQTIKAKVFAAGFLPSETVTIHFYKRGYVMPPVTGTAPDPAYPGTGLSGLTDMMAGVTDLHFKTWLGYHTDTVTYFLELKKKEKLQHLMLDLLQQKGSWVYLPEKIMVSVWNDAGGRYEPVLNETYNQVTKDEGIVASMLNFPANTSGRKLKIQIVPRQKIPSGSPGENEKAWFFIDEINLN